ncbi:MAG: hypothetical protein IPP64_10755 [Bacteroidetes bacterium]|nr:hypothetical protein [Bacteroidota bacterium]
MKKIILSLLVVASGTFAKAQDAKSALSATEIVWFGLDFTKAKFVGGFDQVGGAGVATGSDMKTKWIPGWNALILNEPQHFDFKKSFRKDNIVYDLKSMNELNSKIDVDACMVYNEGKIERTEIDGMVKKYKAEVKKDGIGLSFIIENFNKGTQMADIYVTFFDIASKKILICEKVSGKAMGIGMRNYWAGAIKAILKQIDASEYKNWKSKY